MKSIATLIVCFCLLTLGCKTTGDCCSGCNKDAHAKAHAKAKWTATPLIGDDLSGWEKIDYGTQGEINVKDGVLNIDMDLEINAIRYTGDLKALFGPTLDNYAITLQAQRVEGTDIFLGLTFPVGDKGSVSLVLGGWGGAVTGISNLDGLNASENSTTKYTGLKDKQWYRVKVYVTTEKIECWLDGKKIVDEPRADYTKFDTHSAVIDTKPFGLFTYATWGAFKDLKVWKPAK